MDDLQVMDDTRRAMEGKKIRKSDPIPELQ